MYFGYCEGDIKESIKKQKSPHSTTCCAPGITKTINVVVKSSISHIARQCEHQRGWESKKSNLRGDQRIRCIAVGKSIHIEKTDWAKDHSQ